MSRAPGTGADRRVACAAVACLVSIALVMYRPWVARPFSILDFSEFIPLLTGPQELVGRIRALTQYYVVEHGRLNIVSYVALAAKWSLLGARPVTWQWARIAEMGVIMTGVYFFLRRLAVRPLGAVAGTTLFLVTRVSGEGWTRMTMGEPLGLLFAGGALLLATRWREEGRSLTLALWSGVLMALAVLSKEMLIGLLPLVWLVGLGRQEDGTLGAPRWDPTSRRWMIWSGALPLAAFGITALVALSARSDGISALYGTSSGRVRLFIDLFTRPWFAQGARPTLDGLLLPGNLAFLVVLGTGTALAWRDRSRRRHIGWAVTGAALLSLALAVLYLPWPYFNQYYALPFLLGPALLLGIAVDALVAHGIGARMVAGVGMFGMLLGNAPATARIAAMGIALQQVNGGLVVLLGQVPRADRIVVARRELLAQAWTGTGPTLRRYALATGAASELPPAEDLTCTDAAQLLQHGIGRTVVISYHQNCGPLGGQSATLMRRFAYLRVDWRGVALATDSIGADLLAGPAAMLPAPRSTP